MGCRFRSRLEARWACFYEALGIRWEYEAEGYNLSGTWYLPDFWLPEQNCFIEIKGADPTTDERRKAMLLAEASERPVLIFPSSIWHGSTAGYAAPSHGYYPDSFFWGQCDECKKIDVVAIECFMKIFCSTCKKLTKYRPSAPALRKAYDAARGTRFEHGETPDFSRVTILQPRRKVTDR